VPAVFVCQLPAPSVTEALRSAPTVRVAPTSSGLCDGSGTAGVFDTHTAFALAVAVFCLMIILRAPCVKSVAAATPLHATTPATASAARIAILVIDLASFMRGLFQKLPINRAEHGDRPAPGAHPFEAVAGTRACPRLSGSIRARAGDGRTKVRRS
jgi:hypothetical protein